jgi:DHA2 family methylenomycin A resistance protein-like MFS transporter
MVILDTTVLNVALPDIAAQTGAGPAEQQWIIDAYVLAMTALLLAGGGLIDRFGASRIFRAGVVVFTIASALCAGCDAAWELIAARALQGVGGALLIPAALAVITQEFHDPAARGKAIAVIATITASPQAFGPTLGGLLVDSLGWRSVFLLNLPIGVATLWFARRLTRSAGHARPLDFPGTALVAAALGALAYGIIQYTQGGWPAAWFLAALACAIVLAGLFVLVESRSAGPLLPAQVMRNAPVMLYTLAGLALFIVFYGSLFAANLYLQQAAGWSALSAGMALIAGGFPVFALPILVAKLAKAVQPWQLTFIGACVSTAGAVVGVLALGGQAEWSVIVCLLVVGVGFGVLTAPHLTLAMSVSPAGAAGVVSALANAGRQSGYLIGVALVGGAGVSLAGYRQAMLITLTAGVATLVILIAAKLIGRSQAVPKGSPSPTEATPPGGRDPSLAS